MATSPLSLLPLGHAAGFDQPFEMLAACHERVERMLRLLERLAAHVGAHGADDRAGEAARDVCRYFDQAAPAHHEDEERHVLPRLRALGNPAMAALADRLQADHGALSAAWRSLRTDLIALQAGQRPQDWSDDGRLPPAWQAYADRYRAHLMAENDVAFPTARDGLSAGDAQAMGQEMAARRGVVAPPQPARD